MSTHPLPLNVPSRVADLRAVCALLALILALAPALPASALDVPVDPTTFAGALSAATPGDTLLLAPGRYAHFTLSGVAGRADAWITVRGPATGEPAIIAADSGPCCNTIELRDSSYIALEHLTVDGGDVDGAFGVSASGTAVHHVRIEGCTFLNHDTSQQNVAISTKAAAWGWIIRGNRILGAGTGMYLGNSDGSDPFVDGLIENNLIVDTIGYNVQIKWQQPRPALPGLPSTPSLTILRHNVFVKTDRASPDGDRPNVLVGGFPMTGAGSDDRYEIYGNFFFHNPRESLLQASGRVSIHDNVFVDVAGTAVLVQNHDLPLRQAFVYDNTIYAAGTGIRVGSAAPQGDAVFGNLIFAGTATAGTISDLRDNLSDSLANATLYVSAPSTTLGAMDFYPLTDGRAQGTALDMAKVVGDTEYDRDFNGTARGAFTFRGAYAGEGANPGWQLTDDLIGMTGPPPAMTDGGTPPGGDGGTTPRADGGPTPRIDAGEVLPSADDGGCACTAPGSVDRSARGGAAPYGAGPFGTAALAMVVAVISARRRRPRPRALTS